jgi:cytochrome c oxidase subunit IV
MVALGAAFAVLGWMLPRGIRIARLLLGLLAAASGIIAIVWAFNAPRSALIEALVMLGFAVVVLVLLFVPEGVKAYFRKA